MPRQGEIGEREFSTEVQMSELRQGYSCIKALSENNVLHRMDSGASGPIHTWCYVVGNPTLLGTLRMGAGIPLDLCRKICDSAQAGIVQGK